MLVAAGAFFALLQDGAPVYLGLTALMAVYTGVVIVNLNWNAFLFVSHFLAEAQVHTEVAARERAQAQAAHAERMIALANSRAALHMISTTSCKRSPATRG